MKLTWVIVLNWNNWRSTNRCLASLKDLDYENFKILVLDNGSTDGSVEHVREQFPAIEVMELRCNFGFAKGNNAGIRAALSCGAEYVWLLNNDTTVDPMALSAMVELAEANSKIGAVGSAVYYMLEPARLQAWGGGYVNFWLGQPRHYSEPVADYEIEFLTGASLLLRRPALESVGLLDERFFLYWEDADICFRLRRAGWRLAVAGSSKVWHEVSATAGRKSGPLDTIRSRSTVLFFDKHSPVPPFSIWVSTFLRIVKRGLTGDWAAIKAVWAGMRG